MAITKGQLFNKNISLNITISETECTLLEWKKVYILAVRIYLSLVDISALILLQDLLILALCIGEVRFHFHQGSLVISEEIYMIIVWLILLKSDLYYPQFLRTKLSTPNLYEIQSDLYYSHLYYPRTSFIRSFWDQNLVRPSTADNRDLTVIR